MEGRSWGGDNGDEKEFGCGEVGGWYCSVSRIVDVGADDSEASPFPFFLLRSFYNNDFAVGNIFQAILGYVTLVDVLHSFGAWDVSYPIG